MGTNVDMASSFKNLQDKMMGMSANGGAPGGMAMMVQTLINKGVKMDPGEVFTYRKNIPLLLQRLQQFANLTKNDPSARNWITNTFGDQTLSTILARNGFNPGALAQGAKQTLSNSEIENLDRENIAWSNIAANMKLAMNQFMGMKDLRSIIVDLAEITKGVMNLVSALVKLGEKTGVLKDIDKSLKGAADTIKNPSLGIGVKHGSVADYITHPTNAYNDMKWSITGKNPYQTTINEKTEVNTTVQWDGKDHGKVTDAVEKGVSHGQRTKPRRSH